MFCVGGHPGLVFGTMNCFVHIIMYGYYFGSVFNPQLKANLTIKRSITQLQIVSKYSYSISLRSTLSRTLIFFLLQIQFVLAIIHLSVPFFVTDCNYPKALLTIAISQNFIMLLLFSDFYYHAYVKPEQSKIKPNWMFHVSCLTKQNKREDKQSHIQYLQVLWS